MGAALHARAHATGSAHSTYGRMHWRGLLACCVAVCLISSTAAAFSRSDLTAVSEAKSLPSVAGGIQGGLAGGRLWQRRHLLQASPPANSSDNGSGAPDDAGSPDDSGSAPDDNDAPDDNVGAPNSEAPTPAEEPSPAPAPEVAVPPPETAVPPAEPTAQPTINAVAPLSAPPPPPVPPPADPPADPPAPVPEPANPPVVAPAPAAPQSPPPPTPAPTSAAAPGAAPVQAPEIAPAPAPGPAVAPAPGPVADDKLGLVFSLRGSGLLPWTGNTRSSFETALQTVLQSQNAAYTYQSLTYIGSLGTTVNQTSTRRRALLQSTSNQVTVYYDVGGVSDVQAAEAEVKAAATLATLRLQLQEQGLNVDQISLVGTREGGAVLPEAATPAPDGGGGGSGGGTNVGAIVGGVVGGVVGLLLIALVVLVVMGRRRAEYRRMEDDGTPSSGRGSTFGGAKTEPVKESVASPTGYIRAVQPVTAYAPRDLAQQPTVEATAAAAAARRNAAYAAAVNPAVSMAPADKPPSPLQFKNPLASPREGHGGAAAAATVPVSAAPAAPAPGSPMTALTPAQVAAAYQQRRRQLEQEDLLSSPLGSSPPDQPYGAWAASAPRPLPEASPRLAAQHMAPPGGGVRPVLGSTPADDFDPFARSVSQAQASH